MPFPVRPVRSNRGRGLTLDVVGFPAIEVVVSGPADRPVVRVAGELDVATVSPLRDCLKGCLAEGAQAIVIDCRRIEFMSAAGISVLVEAADALAASGGELVLRWPTRFVVRLLQITGVDSRMRIEPGDEG